MEAIEKILNEGKEFLDKLEDLLNRSDEKLKNNPELEKFKKRFYELINHRK